jgi:hypothetical protein
MNSESFFQLVERNFLLTLCYSYNLDLHWTPPCWSYYNRWLPNLIKTSLLFENFSSDMSYKTSPSSSLRNLFTHIVFIICCRVGLCCDLRLHVVRLHIFLDCLKIEGNGKQMMMMDNFWSQSGWRHDDGFAENIFTGLARLGLGRPAPPPW